MSPVQVPVEKSPHLATSPYHSHQTLFLLLHVAPLCSCSPYFFHLVVGFFLHALHEMVDSSPPLNVVLFVPTESCGSWSLRPQVCCDCGLRRIFYFLVPTPVPTLILVPRTSFLSPYLGISLYPCHSLDESPLH
ncbi:hypothetical protein YC2023_050860 [Brassica napus]